MVNGNQEYLDYIDSHPCCKCGAPTKWVYGPSNERELKDNFFCDDCVPRGCSCNVVYHLFDEDEKYEDLEPELDDNGLPIPYLDTDGSPMQHKDAQGRKLPCIEYDSRDWVEEMGK